MARAAGAITRSTRTGGSTRSLSGGAKSFDDIRSGLGKLFGKELDPAIFAERPRVDDALSAADLLRNLIHVGVLEVGSEVPAEALAKAIGLHRNTLAKALSVLVDEQYLVQRKGRPARVLYAHKLPPLPDRRSDMISPSDLVARRGLQIASFVTRFERKRQCEVELPRQIRVGQNLGLHPLNEVIVVSRLREIGGDTTDFVLAIAETAYFAADRLPDAFNQGLKQAAAGSIRQHMLANNIRPVNGEYRIRVSELSELLVKPWAEHARMSEAEVRALRFLRFESTTHCHLGQIEYSVAYLRAGLFTISTTDLIVDIRAEDLARASHAQADRTGLPARQRA